LRKTTPFGVQVQPLVEPCFHPDSYGQGKKFGRPERLDDGQKRVIADRHGEGATIPELADEYGVGVGTIWRALQPTAIEAAA
jgi:Sigma-70, region 4